MSSGALNLEAIQVLVEEYVVPGLNKLYEQATPFWKRLKRGQTMETNSRGARIMNLVTANAQIKWMTMNGDIYPAAGSPDYFDMRVYWTAIAISSGFTYASLMLKKAGALTDYVKNQLDQDMKTVMKEIEMACWESGEGIKAIVSGISGTTITFAAPFGATRLLKNGLYNFFGPDGTARTGGGVTNARLSSVGVGSTGQATFASVPNNIQIGDFCTWVDSFGKAIHGVPYHVSADSGFYQGQSRGTYRKELTATEFDLQNAMLSVNAIDKAITLNRYKMGTDLDKKSFEIWSAPAQRYRYNSIGYSFLRSQVGSTASFNGTYPEAPKHGNCTWNESVDIPDDKVYGLTMDSLKVYMLEELGVIKPDSQTMRLIPAFDNTGTGSYKSSVQVIMGAAFDIGSVDPRPNWVIENCGTTNLPTRMSAL